MLSLMRTPRLAAGMLLVVLFTFPGAGATLLQSGELYYVQHVGGRDCGQGVEFLGFLNKTCKAGTGSRSYGPTCGPTLRGAADGERWKEWSITVVGQAEDGNDLVTIENHYPDNKALCMGNMVVEKKGGCSGERLADRVHIHAGQPDVWRLVRVATADSFNIVAESRGDGCLRYLAGSDTCTNKYVQLDASDDASGQQQPPGLTVADRGMSSVLATVTPPPGGCAPVSYEVSHARANTLDAPSVTVVPHGALTAVLGNLKPRVAYSATAVGICADGTRTPPSAPVAFTSIPPPECQTLGWTTYGRQQCGAGANLCLTSATTSDWYNPESGVDGFRNITMAFASAAPGSTMSCWASNVEATVAGWNNWGNVLTTTPLPCSDRSGCIDDQTVVGSGVADGTGTFSIVIPGVYVNESSGTTVQVVCAVMPTGNAPANCAASSAPVLTTVSVEQTCFPADAVVQRVNPSTSAKSPARMDQLAIGDYVECLVPQYDGTGETGYNYGTCQIYYYFNKQSAWFNYHFFTYAKLGGGTGVFRASPRHHVFIAASASGPAATPPPGAGVASLDVKVGDLLAIQDPATKLYYTTPVTAIKVTGAQGAYTPMLSNAGLPIVDGAVAYTTVGSVADPLQQERFYWACAPIWQAFNAGNASACSGATCPCLDAAPDACVRQGTVISDLPDHLADFFTAYYGVRRSAMADNRRKFHSADFIAEVSAVVANGTVYTRPQMLTTLERFYKSS